MHTSPTHQAKALKDAILEHIDLKSVFKVVVPVCKRLMEPCSI
jgi:hypothetical protein